ncbi:hypothetical protein CsSME_00009406 [Camellia sinensis var. sinensis]
MTQAISSLGVEWCDWWNGGRFSRVEWVFKLATETEPSIYFWPYILDWCMFYELEQPAKNEMSAPVMVMTTLSTLQNCYRLEQDVKR